jgi:threonylcarbamoyladenosine tRNA methylthiotransferase MtaB
MYSLVSGKECLAMPSSVINFGCRLNIYEGELIKQTLAKHSDPNVVVVNTCAVTAEAERQARQTIRRLAREHPEKSIIVTGCAAQIRPEQFASLPSVVKVLGNQEKMQHQYYQGLQDTPQIAVGDIMALTESASHLVESFDGRARAYLEIQNGCNHRCTYCTIPFARGNNRSVAMGDIVQQARKLVDEGFQELVFTGVDITDYGQDLPGQPRLGQMVRRVLATVPELKRLRLSSVDVAEIDPDLLKVIAEEPRLMPHLHLSVQSGDNMILKRMKRRHTREQVIEFCQMVTHLRPDVAFGADIIAGFPTESDEMFEQSMRLVEEASLTYLHVFPFSERPGTPAARMPQMPKAVRKERAERLRTLGKTKIDEFEKKHLGKQINVLVEQDGRGRSENFMLLNLADPYPVGSIQAVHVVESHGNVMGAKV